MFGHGRFLWKWIQKCPPVPEGEAGMNCLRLIAGELVVVVFELHFAAYIVSAHAFNKCVDVARCQVGVVSHFDIGTNAGKCCPWAR